jgi:hypothetical protein
MAKLSISKISDFIKRRIVESKPVTFAIRKAIEIRLRPLFNQIREEMLEEFTNHPVTQEIDMGPKLGWNSPFLGGSGDLFSFIGFNRDDNPTEPIKKMIKGLRFYTVFSKGLEHKFEIRFFPTMDDVSQATSMPWAEGRSWAKGIESGISGLGSYLNIEHPVSRSSAGIQAKNKDGKLIKVRSGQFRPTKYMSEILNKYRTKFLSISNLSVKTINS